MPIRTDMNSRNSSILPSGGKVATGYMNGIKTIDQSMTRLDRSIHKLHRANTSFMNHYSPDNRARGTRTAGYHEFHKKGMNTWHSEGPLSPSNSYVASDTTSGNPTFSPARPSALKSSYSQKTNKHVTMFDQEPAQRDLRKPGLHRRAGQSNADIFQTPVDNHTLSAHTRSRSAPLAPYATDEAQNSVQTFRGIRINNPKTYDGTSPTGIAVKKAKPASLVGVLSTDTVKRACPPPASLTPFGTSFLGQAEGAKDSIRKGGKAVLSVPGSVQREPGARGLGRTTAPAACELSWQSSIRCSPASSIHRSARGGSRLEGLGHIVSTHVSTERSRPQGLRSAAYRSKSSDLLVWA